MYPIYLLGSSLGRCWLGINWSFQQIRGESGESCSTLLPAAAAGWLNGEIRLNFLWRPELREDILMTCPFKGPKHFGLVQNRFSIWTRSSSIFSQLNFTFQTMSKLKINFGSVPKQCRLVQNCFGPIEGHGNILMSFPSICPNKFWIMTKYFGPCPNQFSLGCKWFWIGPKMTF